MKNSRPIDSAVKVTEEAAAAEVTQAELTVEDPVDEDAMKKLLEMSLLPKKEAANE